MTFLGVPNVVVVILLMNIVIIKGAFFLKCADGTPYKSEKSFMMSTHICTYCGQHKSAHSERVVVSVLAPRAMD